MKNTDRRLFLQSGLWAATGWAASPWIASNKVRASVDSPNARPTFALIGCGGQGKGDAARALRYGDPLAVCDVDARRVEGARHFLADEMNKPGAAANIDAYEDYRAIIDRDDIDIVVCGTVDHWHVKIATEALKAGKDVYCEKPLTLTIEEGRIISRAVRETGRAVQVGTQQRSQKGFLTAVALAHSGRLGKIKRVQVGINRNPISKPLPAVEPPSHLNWNLWKGPTPDVPYRFLSGGKVFQNEDNIGDGDADASNCHYEFRWWLEYSGGKMTDWGAHHVDIAQWMIQQNGPSQGATEIRPLMVEHSTEFDEQGHAQRDDRYNVPPKFTVEADFPNGAVMEITSEGRNGILLEGTEGRIFVNRGGLRGRPAEELADNPLPDDAIEKIYGGPVQNHMENFFAAAAGERRPVSDVDSHVSAINTCHLANIALRLGRAVKWDAATQTIVDDTVANQWQSRPTRAGFEIEG